jgi:hypothetical protein
MGQILNFNSGMHYILPRGVNPAFDKCALFLPLMW